MMWFAKLFSICLIIESSIQSLSIKAIPALVSTTVLDICWRERRNHL